MFLRQAHILKFLAIGFISALLRGQALSAEWFVNEGEACSGNQQLGAAITAITGGGVQLGGAAGHLYVLVAAADLSAFSGPGSEKIDHNKQLDKASAPNLRKLFLGTAGDMKVPVWFKFATNLLTGLKLSIKTTTPLGVIFDYIFNTIDANAETVREAGLFIADGGEVYKRTTLLQRDSDQSLFVAASTEYRVNVGAEIRSFAVYACVYPADIIVKEFETVAPVAKYPHLVKQLPNGRWQEWDTEDKKFIFEPLDYLYQSGEYYYFETDYIENSKVVGRDLERISVLGGKWQYMRYDARPSGPWKNLALKMTAR